MANNNHKVVIQSRTIEEFNEIASALSIMPNEVYDNIECAIKTENAILCTIPYTTTEKGQQVVLPKSVIKITPSPERLVVFAEDNIIFHIDKRFSLDKTSFCFF